MAAQSEFGLIELISSEQEGEYLCWKSIMQLRLCSRTPERNRKVLRSENQPIGSVKSSADVTPSQFLG